MCERSLRLELHVTEIHVVKGLVPGRLTTVPAGTVVRVD